MRTGLLTLDPSNPLALALRIVRFDVLTTFDKHVHLSCG